MEIEKDPASLTKQPVEQQFIQTLLDAGQDHLFADWDPAGVNDEAKTAFLETLVRVDNAYPGGVIGYISNARKLLSEAKEGKNPFEGFVPEQPDVVDLTCFDDAYDRYETIGIAHASKTAFVMVAGGLGERLGYSDIKPNIPVEVTETTSYLAHYAQGIKAFESRMSAPGLVPFVIMTSGDTNDKTVATLEANQWFGLKKEQIHIVKQELVPAISDSEGRLALAGKYQLALKPHGHGDIHMLMHTSGLAVRLFEQGIEHFLLLQDTNGQVFNAAPAAVGASVEHGFDFNSLAVNRVPGEAVGALTKLVSDEKEFTLNVEYNQLDPLLRATVSPEGDLPNEQGHSMFPGNINILVVRLASYVKILERTQGIVAEFVNPKYADETKTSFKKPTRLETLMQDLPKLFGPEERAGVSVFDRQWCFSPNKNNILDAAEKQTNGTPPESAATAESDFYFAGRMRLKAAGMSVAEAETELVCGVALTLGPRVILRPSFAVTLNEVRKKISGGSIAEEATLILDGEGIRLENVTLAGRSALVIHACSGANVTVKDRVVENDGFEIVKLTAAELADSKTPEYLSIRGYRIENRGAEIHEFTQPGDYTV